MTTKTKKVEKVAVDQKPMLELKQSEKSIITKLVNGVFSKNKASKEQMIMANFPLAVHVAKKYFGLGESYKDLIQVAAIGLIKAVRNFEPKMKINFATYAVPTIEGEIKHYLRDNAINIKLPRKYLELGMRLEKYRKEFLYKHGREITNLELSKALKVKLHDIEEATITLNAHKIISLDAPVYSIAGANNRETLSTLENILGSESQISRMVELNGLREALDTLSKRDRAIIKDHFFRDMKQDVIALKYEITQAQVSRILKSSCEKMKVLMV
jgi:RNA polymerase sigma-B factor